jgi:hypothetical protein
VCLINNVTPSEIKWSWTLTTENMLRHINISIIDMKKPAYLPEASKTFSSVSPSLGPSKSSIRLFSIFEAYLHCNKTQALTCWCYQGTHSTQARTKWEILRKQNGVLTYCFFKATYEFNSLICNKNANSC